MNPLRWLRGMFLTDRSAPPAPDDPALLGRPDGQIAGEIWRSRLEEAGIPSMLKNVNPIAYLGTDVVPMYELYVRQRDLDRARDVLDLPRDDA